MARNKKTTKRKTGSNKGAATLKKITREAKKIQKADPHKKWTSCIKEASKKIKKK